MHLFTIAVALAGAAAWGTWGYDGSMWSEMKEGGVMHLFTIAVAYAAAWGCDGSMRSEMKEMA